MRLAAFANRVALIFFVFLTFCLNVLVIFLAADCFLLADGDSDAGDGNGPIGDTGDEFGVTGPIGDTGDVLGTLY